MFDWYGLITFIWQKYREDVYRKYDVIKYFPRNFGSGESIKSKNIMSHLFIDDLLFKGRERSSTSASTSTFASNSVRHSNGLTLLHPEILFNLKDSSVENGFRHVFQHYGNRSVLLEHLIGTRDKIHVLHWRWNRTNYCTLESRV